MQESIFKLTRTRQIQVLLIDIITFLVIWLLPFYLIENESQIFYLAYPVVIQIIIQYIEGAYEINPIWQDYSRVRLAATIVVNLFLSFIISKYLIMLCHKDLFLKGSFYLSIILPLQSLALYFSRKFNFYLKIIYPVTQSLLIVGELKDARYLASWLKAQNISRTRFKIKDVIDLNGLTKIDWEDKQESHYERKTCFGDTSQYDIIITFHEQNIDTREARALMNFASQNNFVLSFANFCGHLESNYPIEYIDTNWILNTTNNLWLKINIYLRIRSLFDICFSVFLLILTLPIWTTVIILIPLTSKGPILFRQERVGKLGKKFQLLKFRSMREDAEAEGPQMTGEKDVRITTIGNFMRRTRIDELPQLINVIKGEMSLIGPRPEREYFENVLKQDLPLIELRNLIKPGITGLAQIRARYANDVASYKVKLGYDIYYIKNLSPLLDIAILFQTIRTVLFQKGQ